MKGYIEFSEFARQVVADYWNEKSDTTNEVSITIDDVFLTWYAKELQNQKAMLATNQPDGTYFEVTWNGDEGEAYLDVYKKWENRVITPGYTE